MVWNFFKSNKKTKNKSTDKPINLDALSKEETFALALGDLEHKRIANELEDCNLVNYLEKEWNIEFNENDNEEYMIYLLQKIWKSGTVSWYWEHRKLHHKIDVKDLVAFDSVRFTELIRQAIYLKYIDEESAWGLLFLNAQRVQESFSGWEDFKSSYFRAVVFYNIVRKMKEDKQEEAISKFDELVELLVNENNIEILWLNDALFEKIKIKGI